MLEDPDHYTDDQSYSDIKKVNFLTGNTVLNLHLFEEQSVLRPPKNNEINRVHRMKEPIKTKLETSVEKKNLCSKKKKKSFPSAVLTKYLTAH